MKLWPFGKKQQGGNDSGFELPPGVVLAASDEVEPISYAVGEPQQHTEHPVPQAPAGPSAQAPAAPAASAAPHAFQASPAAEPLLQTTEMAAPPQPAAPAQPYTPYNTPPNPAATEAKPEDLNQFFDQNNLSMISPPPVAAHPAPPADAFAPPPQPMGESAAPAAWQASPPAAPEAAFAPPPAEEPFVLSADMMAPPAEPMPAAEFAPPPAAPETAQALPPAPDAAFFAPPPEAPPAYEFTAAPAAQQPDAQDPFAPPPMQAAYSPQPDAFDLTPASQPEPAPMAPPQPSALSLDDAAVFEFEPAPQPRNASNAPMAKSAPSAPPATAMPAEQAATDPFLAVPAEPMSAFAETPETPTQAPSLLDAFESLDSLAAPPDLTYDAGFYQVSEPAMMAEPGFGESAEAPQPGFYEPAAPSASAGDGDENFYLIGGANNETSADNSDFYLLGPTETAFPGDLTAMQDDALYGGYGDTVAPQSAAPAYEPAAGSPDPTDGQGDFLPDSYELSVEAPADWTAESAPAMEEAFDIHATYDHPTYSEGDPLALAADTAEADAYAPDGTEDFSLDAGLSADMGYDLGYESKGGPLNREDYDLGHYADPDEEPSYIVLGEEEPAAFAPNPAPPAEPAMPEAFSATAAFGETALFDFSSPATDEPAAEFRADEPAQVFGEPEAHPVYEAYEPSAAEADAPLYALDAPEAAMTDAPEAYTEENQAAYAFGGAETPAAYEPAESDTMQMVYPAETVGTMQTAVEEPETVVAEVLPPADLRGELRFDEAFYDEVFAQEQHQPAAKPMPEPMPARPAPRAERTAFSFQRHQETRPRQYTGSMADRLADFEQEVILKESRFLKRSLDDLVNRYFAQSDEEGAW